ncbi:MAG TPA: hypothetical protein VGV15_23770 [Terriglobales bacterium]|nr:hypothetical protein [Terriglobales bacterium]
MAFDVSSGEILLAWGPDLELHQTRVAIEAGDIGPPGFSFDPPQMKERFLELVRSTPQAAE